MIGLPKVFIHGFLGCPSDWEHIGDTFDYYFCIPGHSKKAVLMEKNWFPHTIAQLEKFTKHLPAFELIGYSLGARIALAFATQFPESIQKLSLISGHIGYSDSSLKTKQKTIEDATLALLKNNTYESFLKKWYQQDLFQPLTPQQLDRLIHKRSLQNHNDIIAAFEGFRHCYYPSQLNTLKMLARRTHFIVGEADKKYFQLALQLKKEMPYLYIDTVPEAAHSIITSHPNELKALLKKRLS